MSAERGALALFTADFVSAPGRVIRAGFLRKCRAKLGAGGRKAICRKFVEMYAAQRVARFLGMRLGARSDCRGRGAEGLAETADLDRWSFR